MMRLLAPEVIQTSAMDCGPAALKCVLEGYGIRASYGRLREACHTAVDGTSVDDLEDIGRLLGLDAEQVMAPVEHVLAGQDLLPCLAVVRSPEGGTHLVVIWRQHGRFLQIMDPARGRRWVSKDQLRDQLYVHAHSVPAESWGAWAESDSFSGTQRRRLSALGLQSTDADRLLQEAANKADWRAAAHLDAALRMSESLLRSGAVRRGREARCVLQHLNASTIPDHCYAASADRDIPDHVVMRGAVLIQIRGTTAAAPDTAPEIRAVLSEHAARPGRQILDFIRVDNKVNLLALVSVFAVSGIAAAAEGLLMRSILDVRTDLSLAGQKIGAWLGLLMFLAIVPLINVPRTAAVLRLSRLLELRFRLALLRKLPLLGETYFHTRLISDMAERAHSLHLLRSVPELGATFLQLAFELFAISAGLCWLYPSSAPLVVLLTITQVALPLGALPLLSEQELRFRTHTGALSRFYLDALIGATALRAHAGEAALRRAHADVLRQWARSGMRLQNSLTLLEGVHTAAGFGFAAWIVFRHISASDELASALLLAYWTLMLPMLGQELSAISWQYPMLRSVTLRAMEPLGSLEAEHVATDMQEPRRDSAAAEIQFRNVSVVANGSQILGGINLTVPAGSHIAITGPSGAGKSTLIRLLNGSHLPASGEILVDGVLLDSVQIDALRRRIAWIGADVHLWNSSLLENVAWGNDRDLAGLQAALTVSGVDEIQGGLPDGLSSNLGDAGGRLAASEGERVRMCRALLRKDVRLVLLDEPCRGFDSDTRLRLIHELRRHWSHATVLCVTHDVKLAETFARVLVVENGQVVEDGAPAKLLGDVNGHFRAMVDAEGELDAAMQADAWRQCVLRAGRVEDQSR